MTDARAITSFGNRVIISNQIQCRTCKDIIYSATRHDYKHCECGRVNVDGGNAYLSRGWEKDGSYTEMAIEFDKEDLKSLVAEVEEIQKTRNALGVTYAVFRWVRDNGYVIEKTGHHNEDKDKT